MNVSFLLSHVWIVAQAAPAAGGVQPTLQQQLTPFVTILCMFFIMYLIVFRPQQQKQKKLNEMIAGLQTGDAVVISGGIHGIVANVKDGPTFSLKIADNVRIEVDKSAVLSVSREAKLEKA
jgi:preprotein translocase subunit YajC